MRTSKWIVTATLLASLSAFAQQQPVGSPAATQPASQASVANAQPQAPAALPAPTTMDQVVDRFIERENGLGNMLATRTPIVETYLQNLVQDPQLGPIAEG